MPVDYGRVHRLLEVISLMHSKQAGNAKALAERYDCAERTIFRDLAVLTDLGVPYFFDEQANGYHIRHDFFLPPVQLTAEEVLALTTLAEQVGKTEQVPFTAPAAKALEKLRGVLPEKVRRELGDLDEHIEVKLAATNDGTGIEDVFTIVSEAIRDKRALACKYESVTGDGAPNEEFDFEPYRLMFNQRAWYVIGHHAGRDAVRCLKLSRFAQCNATSRPYAIPDGFSLDDHLGHAWRMIRGEDRYDVAIDFDAEFAETLSDTRWHATQAIEFHDDGTITFRCTVDGLDEIVWWVLSMGPHAVVREPAELRERVAALARETAERYEAGSSRR